METLPKEVVSVSKYEIEPFKQGRRVGCYLLGKTIGEGSFAKVKEGLHIITGEKVAVKIIDKKRAREDRYISKNLRREARIHQLVRHPNIIQLYEVLETDHYYYLVMEYCDGGELLDYICTKKRLDEHVARRLVSQLVSAVDGMHKSGVVHRDLKIENFLLNENEDLKIIDFGLSNTLSQTCMGEYDRTGIFPQLLNTHCGSPAYAAPELLAQKKYGPQVDVWSIGINMYAMLTGFLPYMMEPFNVIEMYEKMMQRKMTPVPSFLSQACRDLLMRLLEPVADWRITLRQVMKHKWFTGSEHIPRSIPLGDMMYQKKELCEPVLAYMKYTLKIRTKDSINAVVSNRAVHASAVYHLLVARLDRYLKDRKEKKMSNQFAKLEIIKKSSLSTENVHAASTGNRSTKRFTYHGKKIDPTSRSHPHLGDSDGEDEHILDLIHQNQKDNINRNNAINKGDKTEKKAHRYASSNTLNVNDTEHETRQRGHRRSNSSVDPKELRKSQEVNDSIRNSLISDSKENLGEFIQIQRRKTITVPSSPKDPFSKSDKTLVTRKQSYDVGGIDVLGSPNGDKIDVTKFIDNNSRKNSKEKPKGNRKLSVDVFDLTEPNVKEQKEPIPGWHITKVVKQPPLKEEYTNIRETERQMNGIVPPEPTYESKKVAVRKFSDTDKVKQIRTIKRPETPEHLRTIVRTTPSDLNNNKDVENNSKEEQSSSVSEKTPDVKGKSWTRSQTPEVEDILRNVRSINKEHLSQERKGRINAATDIDRLLSTPETGEKWKPPDRETIESIHDSKTQIRKVSYAEYSDSTLSNTPSPPLTKEHGHPIDSYEAWDVNNNEDEPTNRTSRSASVDDRALDSNISPIKTIKISKKTLELNVKQFTQFKMETHSSTVTDKSTEPDSTTASTTTTTTTHHTQLKPLQLKFNFQVRKKKAYKEKQQTRSLTDLLQGVNHAVSTKPTEEQMLSPKHRCTERCQINGECTEKQELGKAHTVGNTQRQPVYKTMSCDSKLSKKTTVKITSGGSNYGNSRQNRTKIFISSNRRTSFDDGGEREAKQEEEGPDLKNLSFDSGYFGTNPTPSINDDAEHHSNNDTVDGKSKKAVRRENSKSKSNEPTEIHSVKYKCIPVYKPEIVQTATLYGKDSLTIINEDEKRSNAATLHKKWGSQTIEPTQEPVGYIPRSAAFINNIKQKFRQERERKVESLKNESRQIYERRQPPNSPTREFKQVRRQSSKQYPIEKTVVGATSPKFHRKMTYGFGNNSRSPNTKTSTVYDTKIEKSKVTAFAQALENAAWRKKSAITT